MATNKNITMRQYNGVDYDTLYPKTIAAQIDDVYSKNETSNLFLPKAGGSMGGILDMNGNRITNLPTPTSNSDPATKEYVDGNKVQKYQVMTIPATVEEGKQIFKFDGISDFKYIQIYFYGADSNSINYLHMYVGGTTTEIYQTLNWRGLQALTIYGFVIGSNVLFNGFGGNSYNNYFSNLNSVSIPKSTILSKGIEWDYTTDGSDKSYLFHMVF